MGGSRVGPVILCSPHYLLLEHHQLQLAETAFRLVACSILYGWDEMRVTQDLALSMTGLNLWP